MDFQISQRADHIVNDIYQWVQFNRAIINARDEPLADYRKYRRLHLLIGDSNMSPFANALKVGTTACVLTLLEEGHIPEGMILRDAVQATREISRDQSQRWIVRLRRRRAPATRSTCNTPSSPSLRSISPARDEETDWLLGRWAFTLDAIRSKPEALIGGVDWISKKWLLDTFSRGGKSHLAGPVAAEPRPRIPQYQPGEGPLLRAYAGQGHRRVQRQRAQSGHRAACRRPTPGRGARGAAVSIFRANKLAYVINWDSISCENQSHFAMGDPFETYEAGIKRFLHRVERQRSSAT